MVKNKIYISLIKLQITTDLGVEAESENRKMNTWLGNMGKFI